jgi:uncharacterized protein
MDFENLIAQITPDIHQNLRRAIELGKWPDGRALSQEQKELTMQALISYESKHLTDTDRVGYIDRGPKAEGELCDSAGGLSKSEEPKPLKWS